MNGNLVSLLNYPPSSNAAWQEPGSPLESFHYYLRLGDQNLELGEGTLALQCYAAAGSLARELKNQALEVEVLGRELQALLERQDTAGAAAVFQEVAELSPAAALHLLRTVPAVSAELLGGGGPLTPAAKRSVPRVEFMGRLRLRLGHVTVTADRWPSTKSMRLFAWLAAHGTAMSAPAAMELLWPECPPERARNCLRNALYQVRHVLREELGLSGEGVRRCRRLDGLELDCAWNSDVGEFEQALVSAEGLLEADPRQALTHLERAGRLCRGEFLEGFEDPWAVAFRSRLSALRMRCLQLTCRCHLVLGQPQAAEQAARAELEQDDLCEQAWGDLLEAQMRQGREVEARRNYRQAVAHFEAELGFRPAALGEVFDRLFYPALLSA